tara:strand:- start:45 stop:338 length:294 start_codon:yes stop_codon:yes gene_type:complete
MGNLENCFEDFGYGAVSTDYSSENSRHDWVYRLCGGMLKQSVNDIKKGSGQDFHDAIWWVLDDNSDYCLSFHNVCDVLGGNYKAVRENILSKTLVKQ